MTTHPLRIDIKGLEAMTEVLQHAPDVFMHEMTAAAWEASLLLEREAKENTPVGIGGGGGLKGSISAHKPQVGADGVHALVGTALIYALPVELGTKPHRPPMQPLADWAEHKLGVAPGQARAVGYLIARKIARKGTEGAHMFERALARSEDQVQAIFAHAGERALARIGGA